MKRRVDAERFVVAWQKSLTRDEVAKRLGLSPESCGVRAAQLRKRGVRLKKFSRPGRPAARLDIAALNKLVRSAS